MFRKLRNLLGLNPPLPNVESTLRDVQIGTLSVDEAAVQIRDEATRPYLPPWSLRLLGFAGVFFALVGSALGIYSSWDGLGKKSIDGKVVAMVGAGMTSPVVEYRVNGMGYRIRGSVSSSRPAYSTGDIVGILYDKNDPSTAIIDTFRERWLFPVILMGAGVNAIVLSIVLPWIISAIVGRTKR